MPRPHSRWAGSASPRHSSTFKGAHSTTFETLGYGVGVLGRAIFPNREGRIVSPTRKGGAPRAEPMVPRAAARLSCCANSPRGLGEFHRWCLCRLPQFPGVRVPGGRDGGARSGRTDGWQGHLPPQVLSHRHSAESIGRGESLLRNAKEETLSAVGGGLHARRCLSGILHAQGLLAIENTHRPRGLRYRGTSLIRNSAPLGPYRRTMPRALRWS